MRLCDGNADRNDCVCGTVNCMVGSAVSTCWLETIAFVLPCYRLRQRMGGWHARTSFQCLIISISAVIVTCKLLGKAVMQLPTLVVIIIDVVLIISAAVIQPAYPKQLRFTSNEIKANVKKKNLVLVFVLIVQIAAIFFGNKTILTYSFFGVMLTVVSVLIQKFKREDEHFDEGRKSS